MKGPNDIWLIVSECFNRHGHHKQLSYLNHCEWSELLIEHCLFKPAIRVAMANRYSFLPKCRTNKFRRLQLLFWIKRSFKKENILDLKTGTDEFVSSNEASVQGKGICSCQKWT